MSSLSGDIINRSRSYPGWRKKTKNNENFAKVMVSHEY